MPLYIGENKLEPNVIPDQEMILRSNPELDRASREFREQSAIEIHGEDRGVRLLYLLQGELATTYALDTNVNVIGSGDSTTCHIVVLIDEKHGVVSLAHFDECSIRNGVGTMINEIKSIVEWKTNKVYRFDMINLDVYIVGGFVDDRNLSRRISQHILSVLDSQCGVLKLQILCTCDMNNVLLKSGINSPVIYGVAVNTKNFQVYPATFHGNNAPDIPLRHARLHSPSYSSNMYSIYKYNLGEIILRPFSYSVPLHYILAYLSLSDKELLLNYSTSPQVEPSNFVEQTRRTFEFLKQNPNPLITVFCENKERRYQWKPELHQWRMK